MTVPLIVVLDDADQATKVGPTGTDMESESSSDGSKSSSDSSESSSDSDGEAVTNDDSQKQTTNMRHLNLHQVMASNVLVVIILIQFSYADHMVAYVRYYADNASVASNICTYYS